MKHGLWNKDKELSLIDETKNKIEEQVNLYLTYRKMNTNDLFDYMMEDVSHLSQQWDLCAANDKGSHV